MRCKHEHRIKAISIPINDNGLDYEGLLETIQKIISKDTKPGFGWFEVLVCIDCNTVLEQNEVFISEESDNA